MTSLIDKWISRALKSLAAGLLLWVVPAPADETVTVDWNAGGQRIDGFGASSAWRGTWTAAQADMFFSTNSGTGTSLDGIVHFPFNGIGLSLLRNHIAYANSASPNATPSTTEISIMQMAQARGTRVWSTPWTPAPGFKSNNGPNGGSYLGSGNNATNLAYASQLANYVASMKTTYGINLYALSVQNEPDAKVTNYEACAWSGTQIHDFVKHLYSALAAEGVGSTKIILPESETWTNHPGLYAPTLNDPVTTADAAIIANHDYVSDNAVGDTNSPASLPVAGKTSWETEVSQIGGDYDGSITNAIYWAGRVHVFMTIAQANAWHYWWLISGGADNQGLTDANGVPAKRMYALGQFARFVRPNFYRINITNTGLTQISAYRDSLSSRFAIIAINPNPTGIVQTFNLTNVTRISSVTPWLTTATLSLASQAAVAVTNSGFSYTLPALSIVTFVGQANPPMLSIQYSSNAVTVSWPMQAGYNTLLQSPVLSRANWSTNMSLITTIDGTNNVAIRSPTGNSFFRLSEAQVLRQSADQR
jgi:glucuronoarabinoxylan endo-1,4-beta-xylanase